MIAARDALEGFYAEEGLPPGGWDGAYFDQVRLFGLPVPIPNTGARLAVLHHHDLHHLVTGYATDEVGEGEISAWTLGTGGGPLMGELYDLGAFLVGLVRAPRRMWRAFCRGRQGRNLYRHDAEGLLKCDAAELCALAGTDLPVGPALPTDRIAFVRVVATALLVWLSPLALLGMAAAVVMDGFAPRTREALAARIRPGAQSVANP